MAKPNTTTAETTIDMEKVAELVLLEDKSHLTTYLSAFGSEGFRVMQDLFTKAQAAVDAAKKTGSRNIAALAAEAGMADHKSIGSIKEIKVMKKGTQWRVVVNGQPHSSNRHLGAPILVYPFKDLAKDAAPTKEQENEHLLLATKSALMAYSVLEA